jgi:predicted MFS family arabinose efflux permease
MNAKVENIMPREELKILLLLACIQFLAFLDFEFMMPLGAYIGSDLGVNASELGELVSAYTFAGMVGSLFYSRYADRLDKRNALIWLMSGLALGTLCCGLAQGYRGLLGARILAGLMAGPAGATLVAIVSDVVPEERRGQGMGIIFGGFTVASVVGLPVSIALANWAGWRRPFIGLAVLALAIIPLVRLKLPPSHRFQPEDHASKRSSLYHQPAVWLAWASMAVLMVADFAFVPYMPTFLTANLGLPKAQLAYVYAAGGLTTLITFQFAGKLTDRLGTYPVYLVSSLLVIGVTYGIFILAPNPATLGLAMGLMAALFFANAPRVLSAMTLFTKAPSEAQRGEFLSLQNVVQQGSVGLGSLLAAHLISGEAGGRIEHVERLAMQNWAGILVGLVLVWRLDRMLKPKVGS